MAAAVITGTARHRRRMGPRRRTRWPRPRPSRRPRLAVAVASRSPLAGGRQPQPQPQRPTPMTIAVAMASAASPVSRSRIDAPGRRTAGFLVPGSATVAADSMGRWPKRPATPRLTIVYRLTAVALLGCRLSLVARLSGAASRFGRIARTSAVAPFLATRYHDSSRARAVPGEAAWSATRHGRVDPSSGSQRSKGMTRSFVGNQPGGPAIRAAR